MKRRDGCKAIFCILCLVFLFGLWPQAAFAGVLISPEGIVDGGVYTDETLSVGAGESVTLQDVTWNGGKINIADGAALVVEDSELSGLELIMYPGASFVMHRTSAVIVDAIALQGSAVLEMDDSSLDVAEGIVADASSGIVLRGTSEILGRNNTCVMTSGTVDVYGQAEIVHQASGADTPADATGLWLDGGTLTLHENAGLLVKGGDVPTPYLTDALFAEDAAIDVQKNAVLELYAHEGSGRSGVGLVVSAGFSLNLEEDGAVYISPFDEAATASLPPDPAGRIHKSVRIDAPVIAQVEKPTPEAKKETPPGSDTAVAQQSVRNAAQAPGPVAVYGLYGWAGRSLAVGERRPVTYLSGAFGVFSAISVSFETPGIAAYDAASKTMIALGAGGTKVTIRDGTGSYEFWITVAY